MKRWEYKTLLLDSDNDLERDEDEMNDLGADGWELVNAARLSDGGFYGFFKRELELEPESRSENEP